jgi:hypothetical protein
MVSGEHDYRRQAEDDHRDFNDELAGRDTGRARRFFSRGERQNAAAARDHDGWKDFVRQQELQLFRDQASLLSAASLEALRVAVRRMEEAQRQLDEIRERAVRDKQGHLVYRTADGQRAFDEDARELTAAEIARIDWRAGAPTWEQHEQAMQASLDAATEVDDIRAYRENVVEAQERLDMGIPISQKELDALDAQLQNMPASVRDRLDGPKAADVSAPTAAPTRPNASPDAAIAVIQAAPMPAAPRPGSPAP